MADLVECAPWQRDSRACTHCGQFGYLYQRRVSFNHGEARHTELECANCRHRRIEDVVEGDTWLTQ